MKAVMDNELKAVKSEIFAYPDELNLAISQNVPDVLMLTNYSWNEQLSLHFANHAKKSIPIVL
ncbi:MAG: hypothetical protein R2753_13075 [Chitinophagales bacterium]